MVRVVVGRSASAQERRRHCGEKLVVALRFRAVDEGMQCLAGVDRHVLKQVHAALATTLLEAAKQNYDEELLLSLLSEQGLGVKQSELVKDAYMARRDELR